MNNPRFEDRVRLFNRRDAEDYLRPSAVKQQTLPHNLKSPSQIIRHPRSVIRYLLSVIRYLFNIAATLFTTEHLFKYHPP
jgi:hypothetical protein